MPLASARNGHGSGAVGSRFQGSSCAGSDTDVVIISTRPAPICRSTSAGLPLANDATTCAGSLPASSSQYLNTGNSDHGTVSASSRSSRKRRMLDRHRPQDTSPRAIATAASPAAAAAASLPFISSRRGIAAQEHSHAAAALPQNPPAPATPRPAAAADRPGKPPHSRPASICSIR